MTSVIKKKKRKEKAIQTVGKRKTVISLQERFKIIYDYAYATFLW